MNNQKIKLIKSLHKTSNPLFFLVESSKCVDAFLASENYALDTLFVVEDYKAKYKAYSPEVLTDRMYRSFSMLKNPEGVGAIFLRKEEKSFPKKIKKGRYLWLYQLKDPGNMGTIIRLGYWFGLDAVICEKNCVDVFNPKVVRASMGALATVKVYQKASIEKTVFEAPIFLSDMQGGNLFEEKYLEDFVLVMGGETTGIRSLESLNIPFRKISIPYFGNESSRKIDSLNVGVSAAICLGRFFSS